MTDRHIAYTVTLVEPTREDDAEHIVAALGMIKGVASVVPVVATPEAYWARTMAAREILSSLIELVKLQAR